jgi:hypothetical protein
MVAKTIDEVIEILGDIIQSSKNDEIALGYFAALYQKVTMTVKEKLHTNFKDDTAIVLKLVKEQLGSNELMKNVVSYHYFEVVIDKDGEINQYLSEDPIRITLTKEKMKNKPVITSKFISDNLITIRNDKNNWTIKKINE